MDATFGPVRLLLLKGGLFGPSKTKRGWMEWEISLSRR